jgi:hypothetical protein
MADEYNNTPTTATGNEDKEREAIDEAIDEGFNTELGGAKAGGGEDAPREEREQTPPDQEQPADGDGSSVQMEPFAPPTVPVSTPGLPQSEPATGMPPVKKVEPDEDIKEDIGELAKRNPAAAELALEDSSDGEDLRTRLRDVGLINALDRAEVLMDRRNRMYAQQVEQARIVEAHNRNFYAVMSREHPDLMEMAAKPDGHAERAKFYRDMEGWIQRKPYAEAVPMMQIFQSGRDPRQVAALITQFKSERNQGTVNKKPDPSAALAVPSRGAPVAPAGIGDEDDIEAGWNYNPHKK